MPAIGIELGGGSVINYGLVAGGTAVVHLAGALTNGSTGTIEGFGLLICPQLAFRSRTAGRL